MTRDDFRAAYVDALAADIARDPAEYGYTVTTADAATLSTACRSAAEHIGGRMIAALDAGTANVNGSVPMKRAARSLGIAPTVSGIMAAWRTAEWTR